MTITLGTLTLDGATTAAREQYEEAGGRDARAIVLTGIVTGVTDLDARLDAILAAASEEDYDCALSLRPGRRLWVRRTGFTRETVRERGVGSFELKLEAREPYEESIEEHTHTWTIAASGATHAFSPAGNAPSLPVLAVLAVLPLVNPALSDGERAIVYEGTVAAGQTLVFDAQQDRVFLDGEDVTPYTSGSFSQLSPTGTTLTYTDDGSDPHNATATVSYRDRWW